MKRVYIFLISVFSLLFISFITLGLLGFFEITLIFTPIADINITLYIIFGIAIIGPVVSWFSFCLGRLIHGLFQPKFIRVAENLERVIKRNQHISHRLSIPLKKEHVIDKMETIWREAEMQYPLSELDFEKIMGKDQNA